VSHTHTRYDTYKDSGIGWLGDIPAHWSSVRIKNVISKITSGVTPRGGAESYVDVGIPFLRSQNVHNDGLHLDDVSFISSSTHQEMMNSQVKSGDIVFNITGASIARTCIVPESIKTANISQHIALLKLKNSNETKFISYYLQSQFVKDYVYLTQSGASKEAFNHGQMKCIPLALPPRIEQAAIAAYLDTKTAQINRKIELLSQKATQYVKFKQSLINETVTRGLDKTVAMKDSGIEWLGEVPVHWEIQRIGTAFEERSEKVNDTDYPPLSVSMGGIVPQMDSVAKTDHNDNRKRVAVGDYVINSRSDRRGASGISIYDGSVSVISIVLAPRRSFFGKYLHHLFRSYSFIEEFYRVGRGIVDDLWTTRYSVMKGIEFAYPSYEEQQAIANYLDEKTAHIDRIVATINSQIDKLKELRKTLINDVVTGKIKVA